MFLFLLPGVVSGLFESEIAQFGANENYTEKYSGASPRVSIEKVETADGEILEIRFNAIPDHYTGSFDGSTDQLYKIEEQNFTLRVLANPIDSYDTDVLYCLPLRIIGVTTKGVPIYNPYAAEKGCKMATDVRVYDACKGSTDQEGVYHYTGYSPCVQMLTCDTRPKLYGVAIDGFPIYGPYDESGKMLTAADLDNCGGRIDSDSQYKYHFVPDNPNFLYCLSGGILKDSGLNRDNFVCNCPYTDQHFTMNRDPPYSCDEEHPTTANMNDTDNATEIARQQCKEELEEQMEEEYRPTMWGGLNLTMSTRSCNFSYQYQEILCDSQNEENWTVRPDWKYTKMTMDMLPCCPEDKPCGGTCWSGEHADSGFLNPECKVESKEIMFKERIYLPNSALKCMAFASWITASVLSWLFIS